MYRRAPSPAGRSLTGVAGIISVGLGAVLMLAGLAPALAAALPWSGSAASPAPLLPSLAKTKAFAEPPPVEAPRPAAPPVEARGSFQVADPARVVIPAIGVDADVEPLDLLPDGSLDVPKNFSVTGWYRDGPEPGEPGAAVIVGHVDSRRGPAVFFRLREMAPGNEIVVETVDGESMRFIVERLEKHSKSAFPTTAVYGPTSEPSLRLITCGGTFDRAARTYQDNLVVFATLAA